MADSTAQALAAVPLRAADPQLIPAARYYDEAFFKRETERLWPKVWQTAARLEEIPNLGDYGETTILDKPTIDIGF